jgi:hypothetical protein
MTNEKDFLSSASGNRLPETLFTPWHDPVSGVQSWILNAGRSSGLPRTAPVQQSFYFTNPGMSGDGRYLWFYCAFPPAGDANYGRTLAVADLAEETLRHFPETQFLDASPAVHPDTGDVYWATGCEVWKRGPRADDEARLVGTFPAELARNRRPHRLATHLTFSADGRSLAIDAQIGTEWFVGEMPLDGSPFRLWQRFDRCYNHCQFSPTDPDTMLLAQDNWNDPTTGETGVLADRLWFIRRGQQARPLFPGAPSINRGHEWWGGDGKHVWYVDYASGVEKVNIDTNERTVVWPGRMWHAHASHDGALLVADRWTADAPHVAQVAFFDTRCGREVNIVSHMPAAPAPLEMATYHLHPHPQFCAGGRFVCYTTTVLGRVDVALVRTEDLVAMCNGAKAIS